MPVATAPKKQTPAKKTAAPKKSSPKEPVAPKKAKVPAPKYDTREQWLTEGARMLLSEFAETFVEHFPETHDFKFAVSCGFPLRERNGKVIGQAWKSDVSGDKLTHHIFVTPRITDRVQVLATLLHELIHAADNGEHGHRGIFVRTAKALGLEGKATATYAEKDTPLYTILSEVARSLGAYPHTDLQPFTVTVQKTYMLKLTCLKCECIVRMTSKWLEEAGAPTCGCGGAFEVEVKEEKE